MLSWYGSHFGQERCEPDPVLSLTAQISRGAQVNVGVTFRDLKAILFVYGTQFLVRCANNPNCVLGLARSVGRAGHAVQAAGAAVGNGLAQEFAGADPRVIQRALENIQQSKLNGTWETGGSVPIVRATQPTLITVHP
jgi:hypothetical protein